MSAAASATALGRGEPETAKHQIALEDQSDYFNQAILLRWVRELQEHFEQTVGGAW
jgi:hypothetical protein